MNLLEIKAKCAEILSIVQSTYRSKLICRFELESDGSGGIYVVSDDDVWTIHGWQFKTIADIPSTFDRILSELSVSENSNG